MPNKRTIIVASTGGLILIALAAIYVGAGIGGGCSSRDHVAARVSEVSSELQQAAAQGKIKIERLADGIKRMNSAATTYQATNDHQAYCEALDDLRSEYDMGK